MRSELVPFDNLPLTDWTESERIVDVDTPPGAERTVIQIRNAPALVYEPAYFSSSCGTVADWPERMSIYHGHVRLQMSVEEWEWLKEHGDMVIAAGRVNMETIKQQHDLTTFIPSKIR